MVEQAAVATPEVNAEEVKETGGKLFLDEPSGEMVSKT